MHAWIVSNTYDCMTQLCTEKKSTTFYLSETLFTAKECQKIDLILLNINLSMQGLKAEAWIVVENM